MFQLSRRNIFIVSLFNELLKLSSGNLSGLNRIHGVYNMSGRIVLCYYGPDNCYGKLLNRIIFCFLCNIVFKLSRRIFSSNDRFIQLYVMPRRIILRDYGHDCSDRSLCSGLILACIIKCLFKLFIGNLLIVCFYNELFQLSCGSLPGLNGIHYLHGMPRRILLCDDRSCSCDELLCFRILFFLICNGVF